MPRPISNRMTLNSNDRNEIPDQRVFAKTMVTAGAYSQKDWFCPLLFKDFLPNNAKSSNALVDSTQTVQYVIYINIKTEMFQKFSHPFRDPF